MDLFGVGKRSVTVNGSALVFFSRGVRGAETLQAGARERLVALLARWVALTSGIVSLLNVSHSKYVVVTASTEHAV